MRYIFFEHPQHLSERARETLIKNGEKAMEDIRVLILEDGLKLRAFSEELNIVVVPEGGVYEED